MLSNLNTLRPWDKDQTKFFTDFSTAFEKLETLGTSGLTLLMASA